MKQVSQAFKDAIKQMGRQIDVIIEYRENGIKKFIDDNNLISLSRISNANLLKSLMKELDFESMIKVPKDTEINVRFGVLINNGYTVQQVHEMKVNRLNMAEVRMLQSFEYINLGTYIVSEEPEFNADTNSYTHKCYDKMIYAMKNYEDMNITYPISLKNFLKAVSEKIGLSYSHKTFANAYREIQKELYLGLDYTYRDVLDEIAQASGSIIYINDDNELTIGYPRQSYETFNEEWFKDINVNLKEKYGPINSIVLSRSAGSDNVYIQDQESIEENGLCEIKIQDNQIMNWEDRSDYLTELLAFIGGTTYYINDVSSTGITFLDIRDMYNMQIDGVNYPCILLNDEINITQGLEENIYAEMPEQSETDYNKADKTDRKFEKINNALIEVDKQQGKINLEVSKKLDKDKFVSAEIIMAINGDESSTEINADKISLVGKEIDLTADNVKIASDNCNINKFGKISLKDTGNLGENTTNLKITNNNNDYNVVGSTGIIGETGDREYAYELTKDIIGISKSYDGGLSSSEWADIRNDNNELYFHVYTPNNETTIKASGIVTPSVIQTSLESEKKNFEKLENATEILKHIDIYKYNFKNEIDGTKKHIGFVIGDKFNYREEVTSRNNNGVDTYSFISLCCKAIQELSEKVEILENKINEMEGK